MHNSQILETVLSRLSEYNVHLKLSKCSFLVPKVVYLGFEYSGEGLKPVEGSIQAIKNDPAPENVAQLRSLECCNIIIRFSQIWLVC